MDDPFITFMSGVQALRRQAEALTWGIGGALGVAADPYPHQINNVHGILEDIKIRHLIADEVGLGKTVQALMIVNALRWQNPKHRTVVLAPERLIGQWLDETWTRGHITAAVVRPEEEEEERNEEPSIILVRPRDILDRVFRLDQYSHDLLIIDEPQSIPIEVMRRVAAESSGLSTTARIGFRQVLVLSATPRLSDLRWREIIYEILEPERTGIARSEGISVDQFFSMQENEAIELLKANTGSGQKRDGELAYLKSSTTRRIKRQTRENWGKYLPGRKNSEVIFKPIEAELKRLDIVNEILKTYPDDADLARSPWSEIKEILRSRLSARTALDRLNIADLDNRIRDARNLTVEDPGDSRFEALLDILSSEWSSRPEERFIIVAGDASTIDMLSVSLPRYFPELAEENSITSLKRPPAATEETAQDIQQMHEAVQPFINGDAKILLLGDWIQAGLNLHHNNSRNMIFYSLPWDPQAVDQLIGRIDRLRRKGLQRGEEGISLGLVRIWRLLMRHSPETAISNAMNAIKLFDRPLPQLSEEDSTTLDISFETIARRKHSEKSIRTLQSAAEAWDARGLISRLEKYNPDSLVESVDRANRFMQLLSVEPSMGHAGQNSSPIERSEIANRYWLKLLKNSNTFQILDQPDRINPKIYVQTIWYLPRKAGKPFPLDELGTERRITGHAAFISERRKISSPPRKKVVTDEGQEGGRLLRFFDHGESIHDDLIKGFTKICDTAFLYSRNMPEISVRVGPEHPASKFARKSLMLSAGLFDAGQILDCDQVPPSLQAVVDESSGTAQRRRLEADIFEFKDQLRSDQRWLRSIIPAALELRGSYLEEGNWVELNSPDVVLLFKPLGEDGNFKPSPRTLPPFGDLPKFDLMKLCKHAHANSISETTKRMANLEMEKYRSEVEKRLFLIAGESEDLMRIRQIQLESGQRDTVAEVQRDMIRGQLAALERRLQFSEMLANERKMRLFNAVSRVTSQPLYKLWHLPVRFVPEEN